jgi:diguanylate cyclase (GGDEF)-like protein
MSLFPLQKPVTSAEALVTTYQGHQQDMTHSAAYSDHSLVRIGMIRRYPNGAPVLLGVMLVSGIATLDWATGPTVDVSLLYVVAVMAVTWAGTRRHGILVAGLAAAQSLLASVVEVGRLPMAALWNATTRLGALVLVSALLGLLRNALADQRRMAMVDPLTGVLNRRAFQLVAERERLRAGRDGGALSLAYFDIDDFKQINDARGHAFGDGLLTEFATTMVGAVRGTDIVCRMGGDEFVLLLPDTDAREAMIVIGRVRHLIYDHCIVDARPITTSVGIATYRFPPSTVDAIISGADDLMYQAKDRGGDTVVGMVIVGPWTRWSDSVSLTQPAENTRVF